MNSVYRDEMISNWLSIGLFVSFHLINLVFILISIVKFDEWNDDKFISRFGSLQDGMNIEK